MLAQGLKDQVKAVFANLSNEYTLKASVSEDHPKREELVGLLTDVAGCSDKVSFVEQKGKALSFEVLQNEESSSNIQFKMVPNGHEFTTLLLAVLNKDGIGEKPARVYEVEELKLTDAWNDNGGAGNYDKTIVNALMHYDKNSLSTIGDELRPGIVHRIDKNTSGLIVIAKNNETHENLSKQFSDHTITRIYQLLIWGKLRPSTGRIDTFITRSSKNRQLMEVSRSKGKQAITNYKTIEIFENDKTPTLSLVECKLETGRTHQIRVHMTYMGNSIVGDDKYKKKYKKLKNIDFGIETSISKLDRQFLHAKTLGFIHPKTNEEMIFSSILPQELNNLLKMLRNTG